MFNHQPPAPADIPVAALHASTIRAMSIFVQQPSAEVAETIVRILDALSQHPQRFVAPCGHDVYATALITWRSLASHMRARIEQRQASPLH